MTARKRSNTWYIDFRFCHRRYRLKSPVNTRAGAGTFEASVRQQLARGESLVSEAGLEKEVPTFAAFAVEWMSSYVETNNKHSEIRNKRSILRFRLIPFFGKLPLDQITIRSIEEYKAIELKSKLKNKSINNHLSCLRKCLNTAREWGIIREVPQVRLLKVPPPETFFLKPEECDALLAAAHGSWRDMIFTVLRTGLRFGELIALQWTDIDFERRILTVQRSIVRGQIGGTKSNRIRKIPFTSDLGMMLLGRRRTSQFVFTNEKGDYFKQDTCRIHMRALAKQAGIRPIGWHTLRHTFASHLANNGVTVQVIQQLLGHSDLKTTLRYAHIAPETLVGAVEVLPLYSGKLWAQDGHKNQTLSSAAL